jgi:hypothetical protein
LDILVAERAPVCPRLVDVIPTLDADYVCTCIGWSTKMRIVHFGPNDATGAALIGLRVTPIAFLVIGKVAGHLRI